MSQPVLHHYKIGEHVIAFSTTRQGGCSKGNYAEFNINVYCGDSVEHIQRNRAALCDLLGITDDRLVMPHQVHDTRIAAIDSSFLHLPAAERQELLEGVDALMTNLPGVCIGVSTADCIPVLLYDAKLRAVCAIHAGWRGTVKRIVEKSLAALTATYGSRPEDVYAQICPGISLDSFEVGDEVFEAFQQEGFPMELISKKYGPKWHINLPECNRLQLLSCGVPESHIHVSPICTYKHHDLFFSARRLGIHSGRIFSGIMIEENYK